MSAPRSRAAAPGTPWQAVPEWAVDVPAALEILWGAHKRRYVLPFLGRESSLAEAAAEVAAKKPAMSYWIDRLLEAGLIRLTAVAHVGRHRVSRYRCVADRLRVSLRDAPLESFESVCAEFSARWRQLADRALARAVAAQAPDMELVITRDPVAGALTRLLPRSGAAPDDDYIDYWARLWLSPQDQAELRRDLDALWDKYEQRTDRAAHGSSVLMHLMVVPEVK